MLPKFVVALWSFSMTDWLKSPRNPRFYAAISEIVTSPNKPLCQCMYVQCSTHAVQRSCVRPIPHLSICVAQFLKVTYIRIIFSRSRTMFFLYFSLNVKLNVISVLCITKMLFYLQDWVQAVAIRITLNRINTFGDEVFKDPKVLKSYYYAITDLSIGAR